MNRWYIYNLSLKDTPSSIMLQSDEIGHFEFLPDFGSIGHMDNIYLIFNAKFML